MTDERKVVNEEELIGHAAIIELATPQEAQTILNVQKEAYLSAYPNQQLGITLEDIQQKVDTFTSEASIVRVQKKISSDSSSRWWVGKVEGEIVGFITAKKTEGNHRISRIFVLPEYQHRGVGKKLLQVGVAWLGRDEPIKLQVISHNSDAINFYKGFGFTESGIGWPVKLPSGKGIPTTEMSFLPPH